MKRRDLWFAAKLPSRHRRHFFAREKASGPWRVVADTLADHTGRGYLIALIGERGIGKTQLALTAAYEAIFQIGKPVLYTTALELFSELRRAYNEKGLSESNLIQGFVRPQLLIIDEAHERGSTDFEDRLLGHLIDRRYRALLSDTLVISNEKKEQFGNSMGASVVDRIRECGEIIECEWPSFREKKDAVVA